MLQWLFFGILYCEIQFLSGTDRLSIDPKPSEKMSREIHMTIEGEILVSIQFDILII